MADGDVFRAAESFLSSRCCVFFFLLLLLVSINIGRQAARKILDDYIFCGTFSFHRYLAVHCVVNLNLCAFHFGVK